MTLYGNPKKELLRGLWVTTNVHLCRNWQSSTEQDADLQNRKIVKACANVDDTDDAEDDHDNRAAGSTEYLFTIKRTEHHETRTIGHLMPRRPQSFTSCIVAR